MRVNSGGNPSALGMTMVVSERISNRYDIDRWIKGVRDARQSLPLKGASVPSY
jgi:hypothetical protein